MYEPVLNASYRFSEKAFLGEPDVKLVLRELGARYYPGEYLYGPK